MGYSSDGATFAAGTNPIPESALLMRNIILGAEFIMSHITHLYHLAALDYVQGPPMAPWTPYFGTGTKGVPYYQDQYLKSIGVAASLTAPEFPYSAAGLGTDAPGGVTELNGGTTVWSKVILDYVQALHERRKALEAGAVFSGGLPMFRNLVPGGVTYRPTTGDCVNAHNLLFGTSGTYSFAAPAAGSVVSFLKNHAMPLTDILSVLFSQTLDNDVNRLWSPGASRRGVGAGWGNYLAWGAFPSWSGQPGNPENINRLLKRGKWITEGPANPLATNRAADLDALSGNIREFATWSKYTDASGPATGGLHPSGGITDPSTVAKGGVTPYTWGKAPRYYADEAGLTSDYHPMEVGPLARMIICGAREGIANEKFDSYRIGDTKPKNAIAHHTLGTIVTNYVTWLDNPARIPGAVAYATGNYTCGASVMDRHRARALEAIKIAEYMEIWLNRLRGLLPLSSSPVGTRALPTSSSGAGTHEAPRGALAHFVTADGNSKISNYQCVVPTTWNVSPKHDTAGTVDGPIEKAVIGVSAPNTAGYLTSLEDIPLDVLRVIHSFDPCIACTVHVVDAAGNKQVVDIDDAKPIEVEEAIARNVHEIAKKEVSRR